MNIIKKRVTRTIDNAGKKPIIFKFCNCVLVPTADIAINKNHELKRLQ